MRRGTRGRSSPWRRSSSRSKSKDHSASSSRLLMKQAPRRPLARHRLVPISIMLMAVAPALMFQRIAGRQDSAIPCEESAPDCSLGSVPVWRLPLDSALLTLGRSENPDYDFAGPPEVVRLSDGRLVTSDGSDWPIKIYSSSGKLLAKFRKGGGPE